MSQLSKKHLYTGVSFAVLATIVWAGNFIVARGVIKEIPPVSLAFYRWATASVILFPFTLPKLRREIPVIKKHIRYLLLAALTGVAVFNTLVYIAGHYTSAINMALIGTTSSPVFVIIFSAIFFHEKIKTTRVAGLIFCIAGIVVLLSKGSWHTLIAFRFGIGDLWVLLGALSFAIYSIMVRQKPRELSSINFLNIIFFFGTLMLLPFFMVEKATTTPVVWTTDLFLIILYLGGGTSVIAFLLWNAAIEKIGTVRTSLFGNLIPIFASIEAIWILGENLTGIHIISGVLVLIGLLLANSRHANQTHTTQVKA